MAVLGPHGEEVRRAQGRQERGALHRDRPRRDQAAQVRARLRPDGQAARAHRDAARRLQDQRRQRHPRVHGVRGAGTQSVKVYHPEQLPGHAFAKREDHDEAGPRGTTLPSRQV